MPGGGKVLQESLKPLKKGVQHGQKVKTVLPAKIVAGKRHKIPQKRISMLANTQENLQLLGAEVRKYLVTDDPRKEVVIFKID